ncbi:MAG: DUF5658 family protein [Armatimonadota bacterium]|nr:DUF5658 family protein [Armatimonadota bacterium]
MTLTRESMVLIVICAADLLSTLFLLQSQGAREGNPLMAFYLRYGIGTFVMMKLTLMVLPVFIAEWSKQYRPRFVRLMLRTAIITYVGTYLLLFLTVNLGMGVAASAPDKHASPAVYTASTNLP